MPTAAKRRSGPAGGHPAISQDAHSHASDRVNAGGKRSSRHRSGPATVRCSSWHRAWSSTRSGRRPNACQRWSRAVTRPASPPQPVPAVDGRGVAVSRADCCRPGAGHARRARTAEGPLVSAVGYYRPGQRLSSAATVDRIAAAQRGAAALATGTAIVRDFGQAWRESWALTRAAPQARVVRTRHGDRMLVTEFLRTRAGTCHTRPGPRHGPWPSAVDDRGGWRWYACSRCWPAGPAKART